MKMRVAGAVFAPRVCAIVGIGGWDLAAFDSHGVLSGRYTSRKVQVTLRELMTLMELRKKY